MPEGPQVHLVAREQSRVFARKRLSVDSPDGRSDDVAAILDGRVLKRIDAVGKHLFYVFAADAQLHVHLGRFGGFDEGPMPLPDPRGMLRLRICTKTRWAELRGAIAIELLTAAERRTIEARIGPDPLNEDDPEPGFLKIRKSRSAVGSLLMDQSVLAGIGNIYRSEILFRHRTNPFDPGTSLPHERLVAMWTDLDRIMRENMDGGGRIVTTDLADRRSKGKRVARDDRFYVYHRHGKPCRRCGTTIERRLLGARAVFWCPVCQSARGPLPSGRPASTPAVARPRAARRPPAA